jgi:hypothetical protein
MPQMTTTEVVGFCDNLLEFMDKNQAAVEAAGVTVTAWKIELGKLKQDAVAKNAEQEALKAQLRVKTAETKAALNTAYTGASSKLDAMIGALGKGTPLAKQAAKLRSSVLVTKRSTKKAA